MTAEERKQVFEALLKESFGVEELPADAPPLVDAARHHALAAQLKKRGFSSYGFCVASHWPTAEAKAEGEADIPEHYEVATGLRSPGAGTVMATWRVSVPIDQELASLVDLFPGADWQEREQYDLVGVRFTGHPDLRRLMMPEDWEGHPLRKDYAIDTACPPWR